MIGPAARRLPAPNRGNTLILMHEDTPKTRGPTEAAPGATSKTAVRRRFDRAADTFAQADFVHQHCLAGLFERLEPMSLEPRRILDLGGGSGRGSRDLRKRYKRSQIVTLDLSLPMLRAAKAARSRFARQSEVQADARLLPFADDSFDMVIANLLLPWLDDLAPALSQISRVVRPGGLFAFATLGSDSLRELRDAWGDDPYHVRAFPDMHVVGDALVHARLADPVLDVDPLTIRYRSAQALFRDLTATGGRNALAARRASLTGKERFARMLSQLEPPAGSDTFDLHLELVFGHAWGSAALPDRGEFRISPDAIGRRNF